MDDLLEDGLEEGEERLGEGLVNENICTRKVDVRLPGKGNSNSHGARPVHPIIMMIKWTSRLSIKNDLLEDGLEEGEERLGEGLVELDRFRLDHLQKWVHGLHRDDLKHGEDQQHSPTLVGPVTSRLNLRTTTSQKCEAVPRRARI